MKNWKAFVGVTLVFLLGMMAGGLVTIGVMRHKLMTQGPQVFADAIVRRLSWQLRLDATQRQQVRNIVGDAQKEVKAVRQQIRPQLIQIFEDTEGKIRAVLRPEQQEKFDRLAAQGRERWEKLNQ